MTDSRKSVLAVVTVHALLPMGAKAAVQQGWVTRDLLGLFRRPDHDGSTTWRSRLLARRQPIRGQHSIHPRVDVDS